MKKLAKKIHFLSILPNKQRRLVWTRSRMFGLLIALLTVGCLYPSGEFDYEKQKAFEAQFSEGMSRADVEQKLEEIGDYEFINAWTFPNGDIRLEYRTTSKKWGSPTYYFRFTPDDALISLYPFNP